MLAKLVAAYIGWNIYTLPWCTPVIAAAIIGILPIIIQALGEKYFRNKAVDTKHLRMASVATDLVVFLISPVVFVFVHSPELFEALALVFFFLVGCARLVRILNQKPDGDVGLPVVYTGYLWVPVIFLLSKDLGAVSAALVVATALAMISPQIKIKRKQS